MQFSAMLSIGGSIFPPVLQALPLVDEPLCSDEHGHAKPATQTRICDVKTVVIFADESLVRCKNTSP